MIEFSFREDEEYPHVYTNKNGCTIHAGWSGWNPKEIEMLEKWYKLGGSSTQVPA